MNKVLASVAAFFTVMSALVFMAPDKNAPGKAPEKQQLKNEPVKPWAPPEDSNPQIPKITTPVPNYLTY